MFYFSTAGFNACDCQLFDASVTLTWVAALACVAFLLLAIASCCTSRATTMLHAQWHHEATRVPLIHPVNDIAPTAAYAVPCAVPYAAPTSAAAPYAVPIAALPAACAAPAQAAALSQFGCPRCGALVQAVLTADATFVQCGQCHSPFQAKLPGR